MIESKAKWRAELLGELAEFRNGVNYDKRNFGKGIKVVGVKDFQDYSKPRYSELEQINPEGIVTERNILRDGDIVFVRSNGNRALIGRSLYIEAPPERITHSAFTIRLRFTSRDVLPQFYAHLFRTRLIREQLMAFGGGTNISNLNQDILNRLEVPLPPLPLQRRIAAILSAYDDLIENNLRRIRILEEKARAIYREWLVYFRFPGHENVPRVESLLGAIPKGWEVRTIQKFGRIVTGKTPSKANPSFYGEDMPFVKTPDMHGNIFVFETSERLSLAGVESQVNKTIPAGSICVSCIGTIGVVSITTEECQTSQQINSVVLTNEASREFLFLRLQDAKRTLENLGATGATMGNVNKGKFEAMAVLSPRDGLLDRYHRLVAPMFSQIANLSRQIRNLRRTRDLLLPRLLSGTIGISNSGVTTSPKGEMGTLDELPEEAQDHSVGVSATTKDAHSSKAALPMLAGVERSSDRSAQEHPNNQLELGYDQPLPIDQTDRSDVLAAIRQVFSDDQPRTRENAIRDVARALGFGRVGHRIRDVLHTDLLTASRRGILENVGGGLRLVAHSMADYDRDFLKQQFLSSIGRSWIERENAIHEFCKWMGFSRAGPNIEETGRSLINGLLRESRLEAAGPSRIRRRT